MDPLHAQLSRLCRLALLAALLCAVPQLRAAPSGGYIDSARCGVDIDRGADRQAYYLQMRFDEAVASDVATQLRGRMLRIRFRQYSDTGGGACRTRLYKSFTLPRGADATQMRREDEPGRVLFTIPRRQAYGP